MKLLVALALAVVVPFVAERAIDGDTLVGRVEHRPGLEERVTVRLDCYSAPELRNDGGRAALAELAAYLDGGGLALRTEWRRDKYGRVLGEPVRQDGGGFCASAARAP